MTGGSRSNTLTGYLLLTPLLVLIAGFFAYPALCVLRNSFYATRFGFGAMRFVGAGNYLSVFANDVFRQAVRNSAAWTGVSLVLQLVVPTACALLLNQRFRGRDVARSVVLVPWVTPAVVTAILARWMLEPTIGIVNKTLLGLHLTAKHVNFLGSTAGALPALVTLNAWRFFPFGTLLVLAALQTIPREVYDAARVDGAGGLGLFRHVVMPLIAPITGFVLFLALVWNFSVFDLIWLTTEGGPVNRTMTVPVLIYKTAFRMFRMGDSSAMASTAICFLAVVGFVYFGVVWRDRG